MSLQLGSAIVKVNPVDMIGKVPAISVPTELFKPAGTGLLNSSCILQLNTTVLPHFNAANGNARTNFSLHISEMLILLLLFSHLQSQSSKPTNRLDASKPKW